MSLSRLTHAFIALLAVIGLSTLLATSASATAAPASQPVLEEGEFIDEAELDEDPFEFDEEVGVDEGEDLGDEELCDALDEDEDVIDEDLTEETELRVADDGELLDPEEGLDDEGFGEDADDFSDEDLDEDICDSIENGFAPDEVSDTDTSDLRKKGVLTAELFASGAGKLTSTLTVGSSGRTASIAGRRVLGRSQQRVTRAGKVTIRIKLTKKGRKVVRNAKRTLRLTLGTTLALKSGKTVKRTKTITVKPKKKPGKRKS